MSQVSFLQAWAAETFRDLAVAYTGYQLSKSTNSSHLPVGYFETIPDLAELFVEIEIQTETVLHGDTLLNDSLV